MGLCLTPWPGSATGKSNEGQNMGAESLKSAAQRMEGLRTGLSHHRFLCVFFLIREIVPRVSTTLPNS